MYELRRRQPWRLWQLWWIGRLWRLVLLCRLLGNQFWRPFLGMVAALVVVISGMILFTFDDPAPNPQWQFCTVPVIKPPPPNPSCHNGRPLVPDR